MLDFSYFSSRRLARQPSYCTHPSSAGQLLPLFANERWKKKQSLCSLSFRKDSPNSYGFGRSLLLYADRNLEQKPDFYSMSSRTIALTLVRAIS